MDKIYQNLGAVREYDFNIWGNGRGELTLTAYELTYCNGKITGTNTEHYFSLEIPMDDEHASVIAHLVGEDWRDHDWTDFDDWCGEETLREGEPPKLITDFLDELTAYVPDEEHDWRFREGRTYTCAVCGVDREEEE